MKRVEGPGSESLGRSCFIRRGDTGPGIDTQISVRNLPVRGGRLFIGERALRDMAGLFDLIDKSSLEAALVQNKSLADERDAWKAEAMRLEEQLRFIGAALRENGVLEVVDEVKPAKTVAKK